MIQSNDDSSGPPPLLAARKITKRYPGVTALDAVDFDIFPGRVHGLIGENGAGKSTLMHILAGAQQPDEGQILLDGAQIHFADTRAALDCGVSIVYQELNLVPYLTVAENIFLGRELLTSWHTINSREQNRLAAELLKPLDPTIDPRATINSHRVGQQQIVEIAKAINSQARVIFLDEPTSAISDHEGEVLFGLIESLRDQGIAIVYVSHKLDELFRITDTITVLRDGVLVEDLRTQETDQDHVVSLMVGRVLKKQLFEREPAQQSDSGTHGDSASPLLMVEHLSLKAPAGDHCVVSQVSFSLHAGEVLGIFGLMGAGRTELLESIFGLHPHACTGNIFVRGILCAIHAPKDAIAKGIGLVPEDRKQQGLVLMMSVEQNISLSSLNRAEQFMLLNKTLERNHVAHHIDRLAIKTSNPEQQVRGLSGGNQQKVVLAKVLATRPQVLMLDEPTRGVDVGAKAEIFRLIHELKQQGLGILMVSSELPELLANADRILVMCEGSVTGCFDRQNATEEILMKAAVPGVPTHA